MLQLYDWLEGLVSILNSQTGKDTKIVAVTCHGGLSVSPARATCQAFDIDVQRQYAKTPQALIPDKETP